jgi:alpha-glucosidase
VPTAWDETRLLDGSVGGYITIARRHGKEWYVGSIAGWHGAEPDIPPEFPGPGDYTADSRKDTPDAAENPTHTVTERTKVSGATTLKVRLASGGGSAIRIRPAL